MHCFLFYHEFKYGNCGASTMTLVQLRHLISLAQTGSFSRSATALFLTQPALSRSIRALESELGQPLFDRIGRRTELTPFGLEALARAQDLVLAASDLRDSARLSDDAQQGVLRIGMGSGPGALLMTPLLLAMATERPRLQVSIARGSTAPLVQALRERELDALVVDARSLRPAPDLSAETLHELPGAFMVRRGHPLARRRSVRFDAVLRYPIASTPLSDEVARTLVEHYGAAADPGACVTLRCEEIPSLIDVARQSDTVVLAIRAAAPDLVSLRLNPPLAATARFALVTLRRRTPPPALSGLRPLMSRLLAEPAARNGKPRAGSTGSGP
jgi:DNA-binding transcriptional LysR family regulator